MSTLKSRRLPLLLGLAAPYLLGVRNGSPFDPTDCTRCEWNHAAFSDDFPKTGHCYMFLDAPQRKCGQRKERAS